jgi:hypothetical protein
MIGTLRADNSIQLTALGSFDCNDVDKAMDLRVRRRMLARNFCQEAIAGMTHLIE